MEFHAFLGFDRAVFEWVETTFFDKGIAAFLTPFFSAITRLGDDGIFWILVAVGLMIFKKTRKYGVMVAGALACMLCINNIILKPIIARPRPFDLEIWKDWFVYPEFVTRPDSFSFPSGHSSGSFAAATALIYTKKKSVYIPAFILAALIAFSRIYIHVHYCTDVIFGSLLGVLYGIIGILVVKYVLKFMDKREKLCKLSAFLQGK